MLKRLKAQGITILVSTPYMDEAGLCDRIALIQNGKVLSIETPANISASYSDKLFSVKANKMSTLLKALSEFSEALSSYAFGEYAHVAVRKDEQDFEKKLKKYLEEERIENVVIKEISASIEDCFIKLLK
jgi:ABC-type multidrug transport system ATPase subunit